MSLRRDAASPRMHAHRVARDQQFFVGGNRVRLQSRVFRADLAFAADSSPGCALSSSCRPAHCNPSQMRARICGRVLADAAGEHHRVGSAHRRPETRQYICGRGSRRSRSPSRTRRSSCSFNSDCRIAHVIAQPRNAQQARLRIQQRLHLLRRQPFLDRNQVHDGGIESPERVPITSPSSGVMPIEVSTDALPDGGRRTSISQVQGDDVASARASVRAAHDSG